MAAMDAKAGPPRAPAVKRMTAWARANLFPGWFGSLATVAVAALLWLALPPLFDWAWPHAMFAPDNAASRALEGRCACWGVVAEKYR
ncbi:MAG: amino acid ABC transporter permease, partial [Noviherbaspirillum sp.]